MAPIKKTRRRAIEEFQEINWWFTDVITDRSNFFRYENVEYPELTLEECMRDDEFYIIDDEFLITHDLDNWRRIEKLTQDSINSADKARDNENPRWQRFRRAIPVIMTLTTVFMMLPALWSILNGILGLVTGWFGKYRTPQGEDGTDGEDLVLNSEEARYFDEFTKTKVGLTSPTEYMLQQSYNKKSTKQSMKAKKSNVMYVPASAGSTVTYINTDSSVITQDSHQNIDNNIQSQDSIPTSLLPSSNDTMNTPP